jgi:hypothetical protein
MVSNASKSGSDQSNEQFGDFLNEIGRLLGSAHHASISCEILGKIKETHILQHTP